ncbi:hypothetical protein K443DRAFT_83098, partial [Laccaria amethystina LaAM-08-1]
QPQPSSLLPLYLYLLRHKTCRAAWSLAMLSPADVLDSPVSKSTLLFRATSPIFLPSQHEPRSATPALVVPTLSRHPHRA